MTLSNHRILPDGMCDKKKALLDQVKQGANTEKAPPLLEKFIPLFFQNFSLEDLELYTIESLYHIAVHALKNLSQKGGVHIYNPEIPRRKHSQGHTVIEIHHPHLPFLVDSLLAHLTQHKLTVYSCTQSTMAIQHNAKREVINIQTASDLLPQEFSLESIIYIELYDLLDKEEIQTLKHSIEKVFQDVRRAVEDWQAMRQKIQQIKTLWASAPCADQREREENQEFLAWLNQDHFTFLGYRFYDFSKKSIQSEATLGTLKEDESPLFGATLGEEVDLLQKWGQEEPSLLSITKTMVPSRVHRAVPMDVIRIAQYDEQGKVTGEHQFFGLFTSTAYSHSIEDIPLLRRKAHQVLDYGDLTPSSHDGKALLHILESLPRDEVFQTSIESLYAIGSEILSLKGRQKAALFVRTDKLGHFASCVVYIPRDRYSVALRKRISAMIADCLKGTVVSFHTEIGGDLEFARIHIIIATPPQLTHRITCDLGSVKQLLSDYMLNWDDRLRIFLTDQEGHKIAKEKVRLFGSAFNESYKEIFSIHQAAIDINYVKKTLETNSLQVHIYEDTKNEQSYLNFKFFNPQAAIALSDVLPILENFGLYVRTEAAYPIYIQENNRTLWMHHLTASLRSEAIIHLPSLEKNLIEALVYTWDGTIENDGLNKLVIKQNLSYREVTLLRAYSKYMHQLQWSHDPAIVEECLLKYGDITRQLIGLFYQRFDPAVSVVPTVEKIEQLLEEVTYASEEQILRNFLCLIQATLRTNYFQYDENGNSKPYVSFKIQGGLLPPVNDIQPMYEIFVYSPTMEGIHLRGGKVARGGIRWSDRKDDYRKEVLELMKAQMVKNSVIVPVGAKGGFVIKKAIDNLSYQQRMEEAVSCYKTLIRGMLDLTDNWINGKIVHPPRVKIWDEDDHYLVVAADKGTATFSDIANSISQEYNFWMGDAFASGGSVGYDHKKIGITSRGAWESVKRHFKEINIDMEKTPFTVVGIGDMAGDVFGNGMLLSENIQLIAAFNHSHIFIDPHPDLEKSFLERQRLFQLARSGWNDYDPQVLSKGGAIFERSAKILTLSEEIQKRFNISQSRLTPAELIILLLKIPVDLLWLGGIGTFVKATAETHLEVGDKTNDLLRVNGTDLGCKIVGEGANLGFTQKGRIEYALKGGKINRDAIDNSAGVDCSDHEVNLKILFHPLINSGQITVQERNNILQQIKDEVTHLILRNNYMQTQIISIVETEGIKFLQQQAHFMQVLENSRKLNRVAEFLPSEKELQERIENKIPLTRPEVSVLISYAKLFAYDHLLASELPDQSFGAETLLSYFPFLIQEKFHEAIINHPLRREIISTLEANNIVNRMGPTFLTNMTTLTGASVIEVVEAYIKVREAHKLEACWQVLEGRFALEGALIYRAMTNLQEFTAEAIEGILTARHSLKKLSLEEILQQALNF